MTNEICETCHYWRVVMLDHEVRGGRCFVEPKPCGRITNDPACRYYQARLMHQIAEAIEVADEH